jgi:toxin ParE1/3/4
MSYRLDILGLAVADMRAAKEWHNLIRPGLGEDFGLCLEEALERVRRQPLAYAVVGYEFRRVLVHRFPYSIYFRIK